MTINFTTTRYSLPAQNNNHYFGNRPLQNNNHSVGRVLAGQNQQIAKLKQEIEELKNQENPQANSPQDPQLQQGGEKQSLINKLKALLATLTGEGGQGSEFMPPQQGDMPQPPNMTERPNHRHHHQNDNPRPQGVPGINNLPPGIKSIKFTRTTYGSPLGQNATNNFAPKSMFSSTSLSNGVSQTSMSQSVNNNGLKMNLKSTSIFN